jgi:TolA-binding protein
MKKFAFIALALWGCYYYSSRHLNLENSARFVSTHKNASWAPRAAYYIAVVYEQRENYPKAQEAFSQLLTDYPTCQYAPSALIKLDSAAENNADWETAKSSLVRYLEEFPDAPQKELATKRLEMLRYKHGP